jgi:hypothetical protein
MARYVAMHNNKPIAFVEIIPDTATPTKDELTKIKHFVMKLLRIPLDDSNERNTTKETEPTCSKTSKKKSKK